MFFLIYITSKKYFIIKYILNNWTYKQKINNINKLNLNDKFLVELSIY